MSSLDQVWYSNPSLRKAIYKWKADEDPKELFNSIGSSNFVPDYTFVPVSPVGQLQLIFAQLQFSDRRYVDPSNFVNSLQLNVMQQQDAQEFCKLFLSLLEEDLSHQRNHIVRSIVQQEYCGEYDYITRY